MVTYGFYNSVDHDRTYDATQVSELFDGLINPGVYSSIGQRFKVEAVGNSFQVSVGTGRAWFNHTWTKNDAPLVLNLPAPPTMADRYRSDAIVIDINSDIKVRENKITYVCGEESANPNPPNPTLASGTHTQIPLAYVRRGAENAVETSINQSQINYVVGTVPECPWVVGVLQSTDISLYVQRWEDAWDTWFAGKQQSVTDDINAVHTARANAETSINTDKAAAETSINTDKAAFKAFVTEQVSEFTIWMADKKDSFDTWFANLQYILDGDVAGHLQLEIEDLQNRVTPIKNGGTGNTHGHIQSGFKKYSNDRAEIDIEEPGLFATSEGMNTTAAGEGSHAEGGGNYSYRYQDAHLEGDKLWTGEDVHVATNYQPTRLTNAVNVTGKTGGESILELTLPGTNGSSSTITGSFSNINPKAWGLYFNQNGTLHYIASGEIDSNNVSFTVNVGSMISISFSGTLPNGNYSYTYSSYGTRQHVLRFYNDNYINDVVVPLCYSEETLTLPNEDTETEYVRDYDTVGLYVGVYLVNDTTGEVLKHEVGCIGVNCRSESDYIGHLGNIDDSIKHDRNVDPTRNDDVGIFSSSYGEDYDPSDPNKYDPDYGYDGEVVSIGIWNGSSGFGTYAPVKYWYIDGSAPENSTILIKHVPSFKITNGSWKYNYLEFISSIYQDKATTEPIMIIKAGNTNKYSLHIYYSPTYSNEQMTNRIEWIPSGESLTITGKGSVAYGDKSHAEGYCTFAFGDYSHAEGDGSSTKINPNEGPGAFGMASHSEGMGTRAVGSPSHSEGRQTIAIGDLGSHSEGNQTEANGNSSHSEGTLTFANGHGSHSEGYHTIAEGNYSHAGGQYVSAYDIGQFVHGFIPDPRNNLITENQRLFQTAIFGIGGQPRYILTNTSEITPSTIDEANIIANKNRNGFSVLLKCGTIANTAYYKTLLPTDTFATYVEFIEIVAGTPTKQHIASAARILQLCPDGLIQRFVLYDVHPSTSASVFAAMPAASSSNISIDGTNYKFVVVDLHNANSDMVSNSTRDAFVKYTLIRLV